MIYLRPRRSTYFETFVSMGDLKNDSNSFYKKMAVINPRAPAH